MTLPAHARTEIYRCDPSKNRSCQDRNSCQKNCIFTSDKEASIDGKLYEYDPGTREIRPVEEAEEKADDER